jgi:hypothetical protein
MLIRNTHRFLAILPLIVACASTQLPAEHVSSAESAVRAAKEVGADQVPKAQLMVKLAEDQIERAKKLASEGDTEEATSLLTRAKADAELALALARADQARAAASRPPQAAPSPPPPAPSQSSL